MEVIFLLELEDNLRLLHSLEDKLKALGDSL